MKIVYVFFVGACWLVVNANILRTKPKNAPEVSTKCENQSEQPTEASISTKQPTEAPTNTEQQSEQPNEAPTNTEQESDQPIEAPTKWKRKKLATTYILDPTVGLDADLYQNCDGSLVYQGTGLTGFGKIKVGERKNPVQVDAHFLEKPKPNYKYSK